MVWILHGRGSFLFPVVFCYEDTKEKQRLHPIISIHQHSRVPPARFVHFPYFNFPFKIIFLSYFILLKFYIYF